MQCLMKNCFKPYAPGEPAVDLKYWLLRWLLPGLCVQQLCGHAVSTMTVKRPLDDPGKPSQVY